MNQLALVRILAFGLSWVNSFLVSKGLEPLPILSEDEIAHVITFVVSVWVMVTNNTIKKEDKPI